MKSELRHKFYGDTVEEWIEKVPGELRVDAVGLWQIVSSGREGFGLSGDGLADYVRRNLYALFAKGAKPVQGAFDNIHIWTLVDYGNTPDEMADGVIKEWLTSGRDPDVGGVRTFTRKGDVTSHRKKREKVFHNCISQRTVTCPRISEHDIGIPDKHGSYAICRP